MATQADFLINRTVEDATSLLSQLEQAKHTAMRIAQRMDALGVAALVDHVWPVGYTQTDFVALYTAIDALPGLVVADDERDKLFKLISFIQ